MRRRTQRWVFWGMVSAGGLAALCAFMIVASPAGELHVPNNTRPPDISAERLERPRPEQDAVRHDAPQARLTQGEVMRLAHAMAKQTLGTSYEAYDLKAVRFAQREGAWFVMFTQAKPSLSSDGCLLVWVYDDSREMVSRPCR